MKRSAILSPLLVLAAAAMLFAQEGGYGTSPGRGMMGQSDHGRGFVRDRNMDPHGSGMDKGYDYHTVRNRLSREDARNLDAARDRFDQETRVLREQIAGKRMAMRSEMIKQNPNDARLARMQQEISELESRYDQKALQHRLEVRRIVSDSTVAGRTGGAPDG